MLREWRKSVRKAWTRPQSRRNSPQGLPSPAELIEKRVSCDTCGHAFRDTRALKIHMKVHRDHNAPFTIKCLLSKRTSNSPKTRPAPNAVECETCGKRFSLRAAYANHIKVHDPTSSGRARRRYRRLTEKSPLPRPLPVPILPECPPIVQPFQLEDIPPPETKCCVEAEEAGFDTAVRCIACVAPIHCARMWSHLQRHVQDLITACEDAAGCLERNEAVLEP